MIIRKVLVTLLAAALLVTSVPFGALAEPVDAGFTEKNNSENAAECTVVEEAITVEEYKAVREDALVEMYDTAPETDVIEKNETVEAEAVEESTIVQEADGIEKSEDALETDAPDENENQQDIPEASESELLGANAAYHYEAYLDWNKKLSVDLTYSFVIDAARWCCEDGTKYVKFNDALVHANAGETITLSDSDYILRNGDYILEINKDDITVDLGGHCLVLPMDYSDGNISGVDYAINVGDYDISRFSLRNGRVHQYAIVPGKGEGQAYKYTDFLRVHKFEKNSPTWVDVSDITYITRSSASTENQLEEIFVNFNLKDTTFYIRNCNFVNTEDSNYFHDTDLGGLGNCYYDNCHIQGPFYIFDPNSKQYFRRCGINSIVDPYYPGGFVNGSQFYSGETYVSFFDCQVEGTNIIANGTPRSYVYLGDGTYYFRGWTQSYVNEKKDAEDFMFKPWMPLYKEGIGDVNAFTYQKLTSAKDGYYATVHHYGTPQIKATSPLSGKISSDPIQYHAEQGMRYCFPGDTLELNKAAFPSGYFEVSRKPLLDARFDLNINLNGLGIKDTANSDNTLLNISHGAAVTWVGQPLPADDKSYAEYSIDRGGFAKVDNGSLILKNTKIVRTAPVNSFIEAVNANLTIENCSFDTKNESSNTIMCKYSDAELINTDIKSEVIETDTEQFGVYSSNLTVSGGKLETTGQFIEAMSYETDKTYTVEVEDAEVTCEELVVAHSNTRVELAAGCVMRCTSENVFSGETPTLLSGGIYYGYDFTASETNYFRLADGYKIHHGTDESGEEYLEVLTDSGFYVVYDMEGNVAGHEETFKNALARVPAGGKITLLISLTEPKLKKPYVIRKPFTLDLNNHTMKFMLGCDDKKPDSFVPFLVYEECIMENGKSTIGEADNKKSGKTIAVVKNGNEEAPSAKAIHVAFKDMTIAYDETNCGVRKAFGVWPHTAADSSDCFCDFLFSSVILDKTEIRDSQDYYSNYYITTIDVCDADETVPVASGNDAQPVLDWMDTASGQGYNNPSVSAEKAKVVLTLANGKIYRTDDINAALLAVTDGDELTFTDRLEKAVLFMPGYLWKFDRSADCFVPTASPVRRLGEYAVDINASDGYTGKEDAEGIIVPSEYSHLTVYDSRWGENADSFCNETESITPFVVPQNAILTLKDINLEKYSGYGVHVKGGLLKSSDVDFDCSCNIFTDPDYPDSRAVVSGYDGTVGRRYAYGDSDSVFKGIKGSIFMQGGVHYYNPDRFGIKDLCSFEPGYGFLASTDKAGNPCYIIRRTEYDDYEESSHTGSGITPGNTGNTSGGTSGGQFLGTSGGNAGGSSGGNSGGGGAGAGGLKKASAGSTYSKFWQQDATGVWKVYNTAGQPVTNCWLCDDAVTANGQNVWYLLQPDGSMLAAGLVQDLSGNFYSLETDHNGFYGMLRYIDGWYNCGGQQVYLQFSHNHDGTFGAVINPDGLAKLKEIYGVTNFNVGNGNTQYTSLY